MTAIARVLAQIMEIAAQFELVLSQFRLVVTCGRAIAMQRFAVRLDRGTIREHRFRIAALDVGAQLRPVLFELAFILPDRMPVGAKLLPVFSNFAAIGRYFSMVLAHTALAVADVLRSALASMIARLFGGRERRANQASRHRRRGKREENLPSHVDLIVQRPALFRASMCRHSVATMRPRA